MIYLVPKIDIPRIDPCRYLLQFVFFFKRVVFFKTGGPTAFTLIQRKKQRYDDAEKMFMNLKVKN